MYGQADGQTDGTRDGDKDGRTATVAERVGPKDVSRDASEDVRGGPLDGPNGPNGPNEQAQWLLLVDSDPVLSKVTQLLLEWHGFRVVTCSNGREALRRVELQSFAAVLTEYIIEDVAGLELARQIRACRPHLPLILLTTWDVLARPRAVRDAGIDLVLLRPIRAIDLARAIRTLTASGQSRLPTAATMGDLRNTAPIARITPSGGDDRGR